MIIRDLGGGIFTIWPLCLFSFLTFPPILVRRTRDPLVKIWFHLLMFKKLFLASPQFVRLGKIFVIFLFAIKDFVLILRKVEVSIAEMLPTILKYWLNPVEFFRKNMSK